jgi:AbrB family looped-hinge helix DNA binding protein
MSFSVLLDKAGRIVIPKTLRNQLHLQAGDTLELELEGESVLLRPMRTTSPLRKERGVWVFRSGKRLTAADADVVLRKSREQRDRLNRGDGQ